MVCNFRESDVWYNWQRIVPPRLIRQRVTWWMFAGTDEWIKGVRGVCVAEYADKERK